MKTDTEIKNRIRFLLAEALDARVAEASKRLPCLCKHNRQHPLDTRRTVHGEPNAGYNRITVAKGEAVTQTIGLCMLGSEDPETWGGTICEDVVDAQKCPLFEPKVDKNLVWREFSHALRDRDELRVKFPEIYGLLWALEPSADGFDERQLPWWKRLWFRLLRIRVKPVILRDNYVLSLIHI